MSNTREELISAYAAAIIEDMDMKYVMQLALETITSNLKAYSNEELEEEMMDAYDLRASIMRIDVDHLLEERDNNA